MAKKIKIMIHRFGLIGWLLFGTVGCDQVTKVVVRDSLPITGPLSYFHGALQLQYARNSGAFLSLGANLPNDIRFWLFNVLCGLFLAAIAIALIKGTKNRPLYVIALTLVLGGGIGNLIDRIEYGKVTDFLFLHLGPLQTGIFNIADMAIVLGVALIAAGPLISRNAKSI